MPLDTYADAIAFLFGRINYERISGADYSLGDLRLDRMRLLLERLGDPHLGIPAIHIAGTKGKGSTAAMTAAVLTAAGKRTGLYTSPHLVDFGERFTVDGVLPTRDAIVALVRRIEPIVRELDDHPGPFSPTFFEIITAVAWLHFAESRVDYAVLEVGLGGRLDATNVCRSVVTAITTISRDHTRQLGSTLDRIAAEKAGIVKPGVPCVTGETKPEPLAVIESVCRSMAAPLDRIEHDFHYLWRETIEPTGYAMSPLDRFDYRDRLGELANLPLPLLGRHQAANAAVALAIVRRLAETGVSIDETALREGLAGVRWPARIEPVRSRPLVLIDAGHNWAAVAALIETLRARVLVRRKTLLFAATRDKDVDGLLRQLLPIFDTVILTEYQSNPRAMPLDELTRRASAWGRPLHTAATPADAWRLAQRLSQPDDLVCVTGSFFISAELRELVVTPSAAG